MTLICSVCKAVNSQNAYSCSRCATDLPRPDTTADKRQRPPRLLQRVGAVVVVCAAILAGFYVSLLVSAKRLTLRERAELSAAISVLEQKGFEREVFMLRHLTAYRSNDNWLNASVPKENAYAATNFPFEIMTLYADFFAYPEDDTERAAILLHESRHLLGEDEQEAYTYVWKNRARLGYTAEQYGHSEVWRNIRKQTREMVPELFTCIGAEFADCTE